MVFFCSVRGTLASMSSLERTLLWVIRGGLILLLFMPLIITSSLFFPFITGKGFFFRIITEIIFGGWAVLAILYKEYRPQRSTLLLVVGAFTTSLVISTIFGVDPYHSFWSNFERMEGLITHLHLFALFIAVAHTIRSKKEWFTLLLVSLGVSVFVGLYGVCEHIFYNDSVEPLTALEKLCTNGSGGERIYATFGNFIYLAVYALFHMFFAAIAAISVKDHVVKKFFVAILLFNAYIFYLTGSRGPIVGLFAALLVMTTLCLFVPVFKRYRYYIGSFLVVLILAPFIFKAMSGTSFIQNNPSLSRLSSISLENIQEQPRVKIWMMGVASLAERPLFGWGQENFAVPYSKYYDPSLYENEPWFDRIHNMSLEWLVMGGIVTFLLHLALLVCIFYSLYVLVYNKHIPHTIGILLAGMVVAYSIQNLFVFDTITNYIFFFLLLGFLHSGFLAHTKTGRHTAIATENAVAAACVTLLVVVGGIWLNTKPLLAARYLSQAIKSTNTAKSIDDVASAFKKVDALKTFGSLEAQERLADLVIQATVRGGDQKLLAPLVDLAIRQLETGTGEGKNAKYFIMLGKLYTVRGHVSVEDKNQAEIYYKKALALAPRYPHIYLGLAEFYIATGDTKNAIAVADEAIRLVDDKGSMFSAVLSVYVLSNDFTKAGNLFDEYINSGKMPFYSPGSGDAETKILLQRVLRTSGDRKSRLAFLKIIDKTIEHPLLSVAFAETYGALGDRVKARAYAKEALERDPSLKDEVDKFIASLGAI